MNLLKRIFIFSIPSETFFYINHDGNSNFGTIKFKQHVTTYITFDINKNEVPNSMKNYNTITYYYYYSVQVRYIVYQIFDTDTTLYSLILISESLRVMISKG